MIKKQQKWISLLVVCTFSWLMQLSTMPVAAAGTSEQASVASSELGPDYFESVNQKAAPAKKKSVLPIILIGVGLITITAAILFLLVLNKYDITGSWQITFTWQGESPGTVTLTFSGDKKSGTFVSSSSSTGTYKVDGKNIEWTYTSGTKYSGTFSDKKTMSGTMISYMNNTGTWTAMKISTATSAALQKAAAVEKGMNDEGK